MSDNMWWTKEFNSAPEPHPTHKPESKPEQEIPKSDVSTFKSFINNIKVSINNVKYSEGNRGLAERGSTFKRRFVYTLVVLLAGLIVNAAFKGTQWAGGGILLLATATTMSTVAAIGTIVFPDRRKDVLTKFSEMFWGWCIWPALGVAIFDKVLRTFLSNPINQSQFGNIFSYSLPYVFAITLILPPALFIKTIAMIRSENRDNRDIEEHMRLWQRQDGDQR